MRKVCIIGNTPSAIRAPYDDESWEIWGVSQRHEWVTRATRWFELHSFETEDKEWVDKWNAQLSEITKDCELWDLDLYPIDKIKRRFGTYFLTSTIAWMIALALDEGVDELMIWGVDCEHREEYRDQRAGIKHFIGLAKFVAGLKIHIDGINGIAFDPVPYPMWQDDPQIKKIEWRLQLQTGDLDKLRKDLDEAEKEIHALNYMSKFVGTAIDIDKRLEALYKELPKMNRDVAGCAGSLKETQWQRRLLKP